MQFVAKLILGFIVFAPNAAATDGCVTDKDCADGHICTPFGTCGCKSYKYLECPNGLACDLTLGCVAKQCGNKYCNAFEKCVDNNCTCGGRTCSNTEVCFLDQCRCGSLALICGVGYECDDGKCKCGGVRECETNEICSNEDQGKKIVEYACRCAGQACNAHEVCTLLSSTELKCVCVNETKTTNNQVCEDEEVCTDAGCETNDNCHDVETFCGSQKDLCGNPTFAVFMKDVCKKTCGQCDRPCEDDASVGEDECEDKEYLCYDLDYTSLMKQLCPKTCNFCEGVCEDRDEEYCKANAAYCKSDEYGGYMAKTCPKTCRYCDVALCENADVDCEEAADYCEDPDMEGFMEMMCAKTCDKC